MGALVYGPKKVGLWFNYHFHHDHASVPFLYQPTEIRRKMAAQLYGDAEQETPLERTNNQEDDQADMEASIEADPRDVKMSFAQGVAATSPSSGELHRDHEQD